MARYGVVGREPKGIMEYPAGVRDAVPVAEAVDVCPTCGKSGDEACVTPSGKVKSEWHAKRGS